MRTMKNKLRSKNGASLLFALLFLLFCVLIGGTVLAAASANGFRISRMEEKQQELEERSAAMLIADELDMGDNFFQVSITSKTITKGTTSTNSIEVKILPKGTVLTSMQELAVEMAVWKYLKENGGNPGTVTFTDYAYSTGGTTSSTMASMDYFVFQYDLNSNDSFTGTLKLTGTNLVNREVQVGMLKGKGNYDLSVDLGEGSHLSVQMKAKFTKGDVISSPYDGGTLETQSSTIVWSDPQIKKEGA